MPSLCLRTFARVSVRGPSALGFLLPVSDQVLKGQSHRGLSRALSPTTPLLLSPTCVLCLLF